MNKSEILRLARLKWELIVENGGHYSDSILQTELGQLRYDCSFCEVYKAEKFVNCINCPLHDEFNKTDICCELYNNWGYNKCTETAKAMLDKINSIKEEDLK